MNESCHTNKHVMLCIRISYATHIDESCQTYEWMNPVTDVKEACHTCEWVMSHKYTRHAAHAYKYIFIYIHMCIYTSCYCPFHVATHCIWARERASKGSDLEAHVKGVPRCAVFVCFLFVCVVCVCVVHTCKSMNRWRPCAVIYTMWFRRRQYVLCECVCVCCVGVRSTGMWGQKHVITMCCHVHTVIVQA